MFKFLRTLSFICIISLLVFSCETEEVSKESQNSSVHGLSKNQVIETKIKTFLANLDNELIERNSEISETSEAENIIEGALNANYTKIWQLKNDKSEKLKDSIFLSEKALELLTESDQKHIYNVILKDLSKKYWAKYDKSYFPNYIDIELSADKQGNQRIDWLVKISKDLVKLNGRTGSCSFSPSDYLSGIDAADPVASCAFQNVGLLAVQQGYFVYGIESYGDWGDYLGLWSFKCKDSANDECPSNAPLCSTYFYSWGGLTPAGTDATNLDGAELNSNRITVENISQNYAQSAGKVVLSIDLMWDSLFCQLGSNYQSWHYDCSRAFYTTIAAPGPEPFPTY